LIEALQLLASPADQQRQALTDWVAMPDEVTLVVDDALQTADLSLSSEAEIEAIRAIDSWVDEVSSAPDAWTGDALETHPLWQKGRTLARAALGLLGVPTLIAPVRVSGTYVRSRSRKPAI